MEYAIIDGAGALQVILDLPLGHTATWIGPEGFEVLVSDSFGVDPATDYADYTWNPESSEFDYHGPEIEQAVEQASQIDVDAIVSQRVDALIEQKVAERLAAIDIEGAVNSGLSAM